MVLFPKAKINLGLRILRKRGDGYHDLETLFYPVPWCDILEAVPALEGDGQLHLSGMPIDLPWSQNLVWQAWQEVRKKIKGPALDLYLHKVIPSGAGLGGGSSDAAYTLRMADALFRNTLSREELLSMAQQLGSDCAFFMQDQPCLASGRGEILYPLQPFLSGVRVVIVKPERSVSTSMAYQKVKPRERNDSLRELPGMARGEWKNFLENDFEAALFPLYPELESLRDQMYTCGAFYAAMSGSGSAIFGLFENIPVLPSDWSNRQCFQGILD